MVRKCVLSLSILVSFWNCSPAQQQNVQIVVSSPRGQTTSIDQSQTVYATFNQPMVPLREVPQDESAGPLIFQPPLAGKYRWMGTSTISFIPAQRLPYATGYTVTVPAGTRSLSGQTLQGPFVWQFETPRPRIVSTSPYQSQPHVEFDHSILIRFNQPIDPEAVSKFISIEERVGSAVRYPRYRAERPSKDNQGKRKSVNENSDQADQRPEESVVLVPLEQFRKGASVTVRCKMGLLGSQGPLGMNSDYILNFTTIQEFTFLGIENGDGFEPSESLKLMFSNPVSQRELVRHLAFAPEVQIDLDQYSYDYPGTRIYLSLPLKPETKYTMTILEGLKDNFGNELVGKRTAAFRTGSYRPSVQMTTGQGVLEAYESHLYPVTFMNIDSARLEMARIDPERIITVMQRLDYSYWQRLAWEQAILQWADSKSEDRSLFSLSRTWKPNAPRNQRTVRPANLDEVLGKATLGTVLLQVDNLLPDNRRRYLKALLQVTNLGITAKFSPSDNLVWVTNLKDAGPVGGASVELRNDSNQVLWKGTTDAKGFAKTPGWGKLGIESQRGDEEEYDYDYGGRQPRLWVLVRYRNDVAFSNSQWNEGIEPYIFPVSYDWNPKFETIEASVFTDRGLYKAGEHVDVKSIVRTRREGSWRIPGSVPLKVTVRNSRNEEILTSEPKLSPFGSFALNVPLKPASPLGYYSVTLQTREMYKGKERWVGVGSTSFRVEAFRPAEFEVTARLEKPGYIIGDKVTGYVSGRYLYGAAMRNESVSWRFSVSQTSWEPPGYEGYYFGPLYWLTQYSYGQRMLSSEEGTLDEQGTLKVASTLKVGEMTGPHSLQLEADVTSQSRQVVSGRASAVIHGGEFYIGIGPSSTFVKRDSVLTYKLVAVSPEGKPVPNIQLLGKIHQRIWRSVRKAESGGRYHWESERVDSLIKEFSVSTGSSPLQQAFTPSSAGFYYIAVSGKDVRGNSILSHAYFYVSGPDYVAWERSDDDRIELVASKTDFTPGETAGIIVKSPYEKATALVSIEREGIISHYATALTGSAPQLDIPILREYLPNVYISVVLLQGRVEGAAITKEADIGRPSFKIGYVKLSVSAKEKLLTMNITTDRKEYRPGDSVEVGIRVSDASGKGIPAEVTLSVADLGVLNLIGYRLPKVFTLFYRERGLAVTTTETRIHLVEQRSYDEKGEEEGGGGADRAEMMASAEGMRFDFRPSAYWNPSIITDGKGNATVKFKLPDNLTAFQIMAVGNTKNSEFGYEEQSFQVNKPLMLQSALPRFARVGDTFEGGVVIMNYTEQEKKVRLVTDVSGIAFTGKDTVWYTLKPGQAKEVRQKLSAEKIGTATLQFRAQSDTDKDGLLWRIPIQVPRLRESVALYESLPEKQVQEKVVVPKEIYQELGDLQFTLTSTAMVGLSGGISYLFEYPYGCLEQRLSRVLPMVLAEDIVKAFKFDVLKDKDYKKVATEILDEIPLFQRDNGGFAYWKNTSETWPYLSAFTLYTLVKAKHNGYAVDQRVLDRAADYLRRVLAREVDWPWYRWWSWYCTDALALYALALEGKPDHGYMDRLYAKRDSLPIFSRAYLLKALVAARGNPGMIQDLARDLSNHAKISQTSAHFEDRDAYGDPWIWDSQTRTTALVMQALVETQPGNNVIPKAVRWLIDQQKVGRWRTTQENAYVVDALATYFRAYEKEEPDFHAEVQLAGARFMTETFKGRTFKSAVNAMPLSQLVLGAEYPLDFKKDGSGRLYYTVRMNYFPKGETRAKEEGFTITKSIEPLKQVKAGGQFSAGSIAKITLTIVSNQERNFVVVEDPVPAGFEIINTSFQTTSTTLDEEESVNSREWWWENAFRHRELYDDRALFFADYLPANVHTVTYLVRVTSYGTFQMPATRVEGMYEPEVFGQTASKLIRVE